MKELLWPITLTRKISDIHSGGFSMEEEETLGFAEGELFETPKELHELVTFHKKNFGKNLAYYKEHVLLKNREYTEVQPGVFVHESARVDATTIYDATKGIVIIERDVTVMPFSYLLGPLRIDEKAKISPHSYISGSYIGKVSNVGGEVGDTVIESYSNKRHHGCIADGYIGSWVNIGGGTSSSSLKNTYGNVKVAGKETGEGFIGPIIADHVKTAINTSLYTGKVIGVSAHIYGTVTIDVPGFTNYISKDTLTTLPLDIACTVAERMQKRRGVEFTEAEKAVLSYAYTATEDDRKAQGVKEGKLSF